MTAEVIGSDVSGEVIELFGEEWLKEKRKRLQQQLGEVSVLLNEITHKYNGCIQEIIETNAALLALDADTNAIATELQREVPKGSAVNDYGRYE